MSEKLDRNLSIDKLFKTIVIPDIKSDTNWKIMMNSRSLSYITFITLFNRVYITLDKSSKEYPSDIKSFHKNLTVILVRVVSLIEESYKLYLDSKFNTVRGDHYTFYRFTKNNYEKYSLEQLFKTLHRYIALRKGKTKSKFFVDLKTYAMDEIEKVSVLKKKFPVETSVENNEFTKHMNEFFSQVGETSNPFHHQDIIEAYMSYHNYIGNSGMKSHGLLLHHGLGSGKTRTSTKVLKKCMYDMERHLNQADVSYNPSYLRNTFILVPAALREDPWYLHLMQEEYGCPFPKTVDTEYDLPLHNIFMVHYNYGMKGRAASVMNFLSGYKSYLEHSFIIVDEVHNMLNSVPEIEQGIRVKKGLGGSIGSLPPTSRGSDDGAPKKITFYHTLYETLQSITHKKILLLSGTPISKYISEYMYAMRLVKGASNFDRLDKQYFSNGTNTASVFDFTIPSENGSASYMDTLFTKDSPVQTYKLAMNVLDGLTYPGYTIPDPSVLSPILAIPKELQYELVSQDSFDKWKKEMMKMYKQTHTKSNTFISNLLSLTSGLVSFMKGNEIDRIKRTYQFIPMTTLQIKMYNAVQATQEKEVTEKKRMEVLMSQLKRKNAVNARGSLKYDLTAEIDKLTRQQRLPGSGTKNSGVLTSLLELCNIAYINDGLDTIRKNTIRPHDIMISIGDGRQNQFKTTDAFKTYSRDRGRHLSLENLPIYSNKLAQLLVNLKTNPNENTMYQSNTSLSVDKPLSRCHVVYSPYVNIYGLESIRQMFEDTNLYEEYTPVKKGEFVFPITKTPRFAFYQPGIQVIFNDPRNAFGEFINVLLISDNAKEGVSFKNVAYEHIFNFQWNPNKIDQIIGRGIRQNSHKELENQGVWDDSSKVQVFYYCSILSKRYPRCMDVDVGRIGKQKYELIQYFYETIHKSALDSNIYDE
jgi:hypothetical protein